MSSVVRATLSDQAYGELRSRILSGTLPGGMRLLPEELAVNLAISQTPIKEALLRLEADGLVVSPMRKGAVVRRFTFADVKELYEARMLIELNAIGQLFDKRAVSSGLLAELSRCLDTHKFHAQRGTLDDVTTALVHDRKFHSALMTAAGNRLVCEWHQRILGQTHTVFVYLAGDYSRSADEHRDILDALKAGSPDQARDALRLHLLHSRDNALENVRRSQLGETQEP
ncbi:GntR family transcriptional regulator [Bosea sp. PAMC 26642]|uniref:GntR family transcriptional regulator n=1 Tax=Bosea sp. (strain PAMC 26642) TaxID=1792307 RepID=UPI0007703DA1|nr:GntR family transcriptional regulator [Bosea sp. PAMC 26642]AMJ62776.1 hypothetical protein AXW83_22980 [Bosea sp. PAMC 26642]